MRLDPGGSFEMRESRVKQDTVNGERSGYLREMHRTDRLEIAPAKSATPDARSLQLRNMRNWTGPEWVAWLKAIGVIIVGLFLFGLALTLTLQSNVGANSWTVLHDGIAKQTPLTIGQAAQIVGLLMLAVSWAVGVRPGVGTILNMVLAGLFLDLILWTDLIKRADNYLTGGAMLLASVALMGFASGMYIKPGLGAGPRDSFMLALTEITGKPVGTARWFLEISAVIVGILLGGDFGVGTIIFAALIGPSVGFGFRLFGVKTGRTRPRRGTAEAATATTGVVDGRLEERP